MQTWGFNFERRIRRNNEIAFWAPLSQERNLYQVSEAGSIEGIRVPRQRNLQLTPYVLAKTRDGGALPERNPRTSVGFDVKYSITPSLTLDATYNTDFAQVEVDEQQVNLDRFSLFFPEKRAFFLENAGQFTVGNSQEVELFFSRRIGIASGLAGPDRRRRAFVGQGRPAHEHRLAANELGRGRRAHVRERIHGRAHQPGAAEPLVDRRPVRRPPRRRHVARQRPR